MTDKNMTSLANKKIAVLAGGTSSEREISLLSGQAVLDALRGIGLNVFFLDAASEFMGVLKNEKADIVFIALHGAFGEDGTVQRLLDEEGIPYTGSSPRASEIAFDKSRAQSLFREKGLIVPEARIFVKGGEAPGSKPPFIPCVVKPATSGSSVGVTILFEEAGYEKACAEAFRHSESVLVERYIRGRELTVSVLDGRPLPVVEVVPARKFYDYEAKYKDAGTSYRFPAQLTVEEAEKVSDAALRAYEALGCEVMGRADVILAPDGTSYVLEVNTIPGLTAKSLLPKAAKAAGLEFPALCVRIIELSLQRKRDFKTNNVVC